MVKHEGAKESELENREGCWRKEGEKKRGSEKEAVGY